MICLALKEARTLLGRLEYQRGNVEAALRVLDGIDLQAAIQKLQPSVMSILILILLLFLLLIILLLMKIVVLILIPSPNKLPDSFLKAFT